MSQILIRNANLVDGTGAPARPADVLVRDGWIAEIADAGTLSPEGGETIEAAGRLVTPGFVDVHTHYDGQVTWDPELTPSSWHGVTTVVMGNCGVGFAPAKPDERGWLIELMEGVEDIPGTALHEGIRWDWETFPEYLDALEKLPRTIDIAAQIPHGALRVYVMGQRGADQEPATAEDLEKMAAIVKEAVEAGALAFSTNRLPGHTSIHGEPVPGTFAPAEELRVLTQAVVEGGGEILQAVPAGGGNEEAGAIPREVDLYREISLATGAKVTFSAPQNHPYPDEWKEVMAKCHAAQEAGARVIPQVLSRGSGLMLSLDTFNPFAFTEAYQAVAGLPSEARVAELRKPEVRSAILEASRENNPSMLILGPAIHSTFAMEDGVVFEPDVKDSIGARADALGVDPMELLYDTMVELAAQSTDGKTRVLAVFFTGYAEGNLDAVETMMRDEISVIGLGDGGAHCSMICDASWPAFVLQHWVRDRSRGAKIPLEEAVKMMSKEAADLYGLGDRGTVEVGKRGDLNVIDLDAVELQLPEVIDDLPTGASRIVQRAHGFDTTICAGEVTFRNGEPTGARPGRLVRGKR
ncbi:MAG: amidohydrolase family protein [bacterium]|nr:amidohydrolase family protein [bacterium]